MSVNFKNIREKSFVDIPSSEPKIKIKLAKVGISNRPVTLKLNNPISGEPTYIPSDINVALSLAAGQRGLHMSRIEECIDEIRESGLSPAQFVNELASLVKKTQSQDYCRIELISRLEHRVQKNKSGRISTELLDIYSIAELDGTRSITTLGVGVPFMNACPCTQRWAMRDFHELLQAKGCSAELTEEITRAAPLQAHTNGGIATLKVTDSNISHLDIYSVLEESVPIVREMLKGIDEHTFVRLTHEQGQFCEDNVRSIALKAVEMLKAKISPAALVKIAVEVNESVHFHNLWGEIEHSFSELSDLFSVRP